MQHITHEDAKKSTAFFAAMKRISFGLAKDLQPGYSPSKQPLLYWAKLFLCQDHVSAEQIKSALEQVGHSFHIEDAPWF